MFSVPPGSISPRKLCGTPQILFKSNLTPRLVLNPVFFHPSRSNPLHGTVILEPWNLRTLEVEPGSHRTLEIWNHKTMKPWNLGTMEPWYQLKTGNHGTIKPWNLGTMEPWNLETWEPWNLGILETWTLGTQLGNLDTWKIVTLTLELGKILFLYFY